MASRAPSRTAATAAALIVLTATLLTPALICATDPRLEGGEGESADPEAEAKLLLYPGESFYNLPRVRLYRWARGAQQQPAHSPPRPPHPKTERLQPRANTCDRWCDATVPTGVRMAHTPH